MQAEYKRQRTEDLIKKGEIGRREVTGSSLGFQFKTTKKESFKKLDVDQDPEL